jgi:glyoxalase family protein
MTSSGLHHVTVISGPAPRNVDFYVRVLGLRLVKKTVNFDDPGTYHLYYGDETGKPGSIITFFPWENAARGRVGVGETLQIGLAVPRSSIGYWTQRLLEKGVTASAPAKSFGETVITFKDADGTGLALVGVDGLEASPGFSGAEVPAEHAIRGMHGVTLLVKEAGRTARVLEKVLGYEEIAREGALSRFRAPGDALGNVVTLHEAGNFLRGSFGAGSVHHVAFRAADDAAQAEMARILRDEIGLTPTEVRDRHYFRSIYFREPNGVLFEIATDEPGFTVDEPVETLGQALKLPPFLEGHREVIEKVLPAL